MLPATFVRNVEECWGDGGRAWLAALPGIAAEMMREWELSPAGLLPLSMNWVSRVRRADGSTAVLKLGVPEAGHLADEATALEWFAGCGAIEVLARDDLRGALLLEEARPGTQVRSLVPHRDEEATAALIQIMRRLHRPAPAREEHTGIEPAGLAPTGHEPAGTVPEGGAPGRVALPELAGRSGAFERHLRRFPDGGPVPRHLVVRAAGLFGELCASATGRVVLHGDLHHDNVLAAEREPWLAIDPHGVVGDPGYEVGALLYNPDPAGTDDTVLDLAETRAEQLADGLGMPVERVLAWGFVKGVLSEVWTFEGDGVANTRALRLAERLLPLLS
ncbi:aminoglycoside phosphotransferase family protein [Actinoplanes derwentensis]|uniref:Streptomycin 6-kinase n=1 Tax=Actinoplanes derwentensis TaxID=113562 RepID=A0A1H2DAS5_9ACTN|nr:aminoglycoside phosphotransferase family protein [Actinoplanes derwentensis]GID81676.1 hydroxyurea phosphotransferase [Actinoplanes derwentensis]SDT79582.1 streptomycin 6-kinase [Actinoplanes derwentensis]